jgi:hypothetical protein
MSTFFQTWHHFHYLHTVIKMEIDYLESFRIWQQQLTCSQVLIHPKMHITSKCKFQINIYYKTKLTSFNISLHYFPYRFALENRILHFIKGTYKGCIVIAALHWTLFMYLLTMTMTFMSFQRYLQYCV